MKNEFSKINDNLFEVTEKMVTKDFITALMNIFDVQRKQIEQMEDIAIVESHIDHLKSRIMQQSNTNVHFV